MKLLLKTRKIGAKAKNGIRVSKTTISFSGNCCKRLYFEERKNNYATLGLDENGNLCIFYSKHQYDGFLKLYRPNPKKDYYSMSINGSNKEAITAFHGAYEISEITIEDNIKKIFRARLLKIS